MARNWKTDHSVHALNSVSVKYLLSDSVAGELPD